jgi:hypothetical protein
LRPAHASTITLVENFMAVDIERAKAALKGTLLALAADDANTARASLEECRSHLKLLTPPTDEREREAWSRDTEVNGFPQGPIPDEHSVLLAQVRTLRLMISLRDRSASDFVAALSQLADDALSHFSFPHGDPAAIEPVAHAALALKRGDLEHQTVLCMQMAQQFACIVNKPKVEEWLGRMPESAKLREFQAWARSAVERTLEIAAQARQPK